MRPLTRPTVHPQETTGTHVALSLMNIFGPYCAFSEEPIIDVAAAWNPEVTSRKPEQTANEPIEQSLPIAPGTFEAWKRSRVAGTENFLRPDFDLTFTLTDSLFTYDLEEVKVIYLDEDQQPLGEPETKQLAIVRGTTQAADATIDLFALNSEYFDRSSGELSIPMNAYLSREDHRIFNRTDTWIRATQVAEWIDGASAESRPLLIEHTRLLAASGGFWSIWATVLWRKFGDKELLSKALMEPEETAVRHQELLATSEAAIAEVPGPGPHNSFPGTRSDWLN